MSTTGLAAQAGSSLGSCLARKGPAGGCRRKLLKKLAGASGFEPPTSWSRTKNLRNINNVAMSLVAATHCYTFPPLNGLVVKSSWGVAAGLSLYAETGHSIGHRPVGRTPPFRQTAMGIPVAGCANFKWSQFLGSVDRQSKSPSRFCPNSAQVNTTRSFLSDRISGTSVSINSVVQAFLDGHLCNSSAFVVESV